MFSFASSITKASLDSGGRKQVGLVYYLRKCKVVGLRRVKSGIYKVGISMRIVDAWDYSCIGKGLKETKRDREKQETKDRPTNFIEYLLLIKQLSLLSFFLSITCSIKSMNGSKGIAPDEAGFNTLWSNPEKKIMSGHLNIPS